MVSAIASTSEQAGTSAEAAQEVLEQLPDSPSTPEEVSAPPIALNGIKTTNGSGDAHLVGEDVDDKIARLEDELERTREERETYANQYRNLLSRLQTMKSTLGNKLKEDAAELDRREQVISSLTLQTEDLESTIQTLQTELVQSNSEAERSSRELELMRTRASEFEQASRESLLRERELREVREEAEQIRLEKEDLARSVQQERVNLDNLKEERSSLEKELESERLARVRAEEELAQEVERSSNLQDVLEDFQSSKDSELRRAIQDSESQLNNVTLSLAEFKHRALQAELELETRATSSSHIDKLEAEVKEKTALIGKLRHQSVTLNEHLTEALRRLNKNSSDSNVDRRLVNNILLSFLSTPRGDNKRFEMLSILATILSWSDDERERAGLQRSTSANSTPRPSTSRRPSLASDSTPTPGVETESFSNMWVEFLMKEAAQGQGSSARKNPPTPGPGSDGGFSVGGLGSPRTPTPALSPPSSFKRVSSAGNLAALTSPKSTPPPLPSTPGGRRSASGKGDEREGPKERRLL